MFAKDVPREDITNDVGWKSERGVERSEINKRGNFWL